MYQTIDVASDGPVLTVTLNRPDVRNAFDGRMVSELAEVFGGLPDRTDLRVVILRGNGKSFSAGADIAWMRASAEMSEEENVTDALRMSEMFAAIQNCPQAVVARAHGAALGGGMGLLAVADVVVAEENTVFGFTEARLGIIPAVIARFVVPKIGIGWARALFLTAERFGAETARQIGLVHWVTSGGELDGVVAGKVAEVLRSGPRAVAEAKYLLAQMNGLGDADVRDLTAARIAAVRISPEGQEGLRAFLEKRRAPWVPEE